MNSTIHKVNSFSCFSSILPQFQEGFWLQYLPINNPPPKFKKKAHDKFEDLWFGFHNFENFELQESLLFFALV